MNKDKEYYRKQLFKIKLKIANLPLDKRGDLNHIFYQEHDAIKKEYAKFLYNEKIKEKEKLENDKHKRR